MELKDKVVIITGGSSGIGKACAHAFAAKGCKVVITGRNNSNLLRAANEIKQHALPENGMLRNRQAQGDPNVLTVESDVSKEADCKRIMDETIKAFGRIDILINNAGISMRALFQDADLNVIRQLMDINFWGTVYCTKFALTEILKNNGSVVGISSIAGYKGLPGRTGYSASKFAMQGFLETLRIENRKKGLHVLITCPGYTASNIRKTALNKDGKAQGDSPLKEGKLMSAEYVAGEIVKGVINRKRTLILGTQGKLLIMLNKFFPAFMDKMVYNTVAKEHDSPFK